MDSLFQEGKMNTPTVRFNKSGNLIIEGRSIPEHPLKFYQPLTDWITNFIATSPESIELKVHLDYLNTHSTECMLVLFKKLDEYYLVSKKDVSIEWIFDEDDEDMEVLGEDLKSFLSLPYKITEDL